MVSVLGIVLIFSVRSRLLSQKGIAPLAILRLIRVFRVEGFPVWHSRVRHR